LGGTLCSKIPNTLMEKTACVLGISLAITDCTVTSSSLTVMWLASTDCGVTSKH